MPSAYISSTSPFPKFANGDSPINVKVGGVQVHQVLYLTVRQ